MDENTHGRFAAAIDNYRQHFPSPTDHSWAENAQQVYDISVTLRRMPRGSEAPRQLMRWVTNQRQRVGTSDAGGMGSRHTRAKRDGQRAVVLNAIPSWVWDPHERACRARLAELGTFTRHAGRLPTESRDSRRRRTTEAKLARWLHLTVKALEEAASPEAASGTSPMSRMVAEQKLAVLHRCARGLLSETQN